MKSYQITYMNEAGEFKTVIHWALRNEAWEEVADRALGTVMSVLEELHYDRFSGTRCRVLLDASIYGRMKGEIVYV